jgi:hypothetical protein
MGHAKALIHGLGRIARPIYRRIDRSRFPFWYSWRYCPSMPARKPRPPDEKPQIERFREAARELGCEDTEEEFWAKVVRVANYKQTDDGKKSDE